MPRSATARVIPLRRAETSATASAVADASARAPGQRTRGVFALCLALSAVLHLGALLAPFPPAKTPTVEPPQPLTVTVVSAPPAVATAPPAAAEAPAARAKAPATPPRTVVGSEAATPAATPVVAVNNADAAPPLALPVEAPTAAGTAATTTARAAPVRAQTSRTPASYLDNPVPEYPPAARRRGLEGLVLLEVLVSARGQPLEVKLTRSSGHAMLDDTALEAVKRWTFSPAREGDVAVAARVEVPVRFRLEAR